MRFPIISRRDLDSGGACTSTEYRYKKIIGLIQTDACRFGRSPLSFYVALDGFLCMSCYGDTIYFGLFFTLKLIENAIVSGSHTLIVSSAT